MKLTRPTIIGIVNVTEDSFSDGGSYLDADRALEHALELRADGADIIELGAASSGPDAREVAPEEEIRRLEPLVAKLNERGVSLCVDSFQPATQRWCINHDVAMLNDVEGFAHPEMYADLARATCGLVVMHSVQGRARPRRLFQEPDAVAAGMYRFFDTRLKAMEAAGMDRHRIILVSTLEWATFWVAILNHRYVPCGKFRSSRTASNYPSWYRSRGNRSSARSRDAR